MKNIYRTKYTALYRHLYKFCISLDYLAYEEVAKMERKISGHDDVNLNEIYRIIKAFMNVNEGKSVAETLADVYEKSLAADANSDRWFLQEVLILIYKYVHPDNSKVTECNKKINQVQEVLEESEYNELKKIVRINPADYEIWCHIDQNKTMKEIYQEHFAGGSYKLKNRSFLMILKGYSSSTPFFYSALTTHFHQQVIKGGGLYIKWLGTGLVIDPGINFMDNFHRAGLQIKDIDCIIVTHNHIDHNGDLTTIDDLAAQFSHVTIVLYADNNTLTEVSGRLKKISKANTKTIHNMKSFFLGKNNEIEIEPICSKHIQNEKGEYLENASYAIKIKLLQSEKIQVQIGFTSDTIYFEELGKKFLDCRYVIANISETNKEDYNLKVHKKTHLGFYGCKDLVEVCNKAKEEKAKEEKAKEEKAKEEKAKEEKAEKDKVQEDKVQEDNTMNDKIIYIISEFWAGKGDIRKALVRQLREVTRYSFIYPGDIGMLFYLDNTTFECSICKSEKGVEELHVVCPNGKYSNMLTVCEECIL
ncbi:MAG: MBL fold metallo-hydrolase [Eubacteriales bacterium]